MMILDNLDNAEKYYPLNPHFRKAFEFLKNTDLYSLEGRVEVDADNVFVLVFKTHGEGHEGAEIEMHHKYIDIQFGLGGVNEFGWKPADECINVSKPFSEEDDYGFWSDEPDVWIKVKPGQYAIFFPEDGHTPKGGTGDLHKVLVKVKV